MATINLGRIKPVNKGVWSNSTAYAVDDFVQYTDNGIVSTYIAVATSTNQAPSTSGTENSTYWKFMAKGVADSLSGLGNNKIVTTNSSGNATGLTIGTAGQALKVNSGANGFEFGTISSDFVKVSDGTFSGTSLIFDNLDTSTYKTFKFNLYRMAGTTSNDPTLYTRFRYDNSGSQASLSSSSYLYRVHGKHNYASSGDTGESSSGSQQDKGRWSWAISTNNGSSEKTSYAYLTSSDMGATDHFKHIEVRHGGTYRNASNEYGFFLNGFISCRNTSQAMNGLEIFGSYNWQCEYQVYGLK